MACLLGVSLGCSAPPLDAAELRRRFPEQADAVLAGHLPLLATEEGGTRVRLPARGEGAVRFALPGRGEVEVRELDLSGQGAPAEGAVVYARRGGASFWSATSEGGEEWLWLGAEAVRRDAPAAIWEVTGATLREQGEAVEVIDGSFAPALRVTAPAAYALGGRPVATWLSARGARLSLWVDAEGEEVLVDPGWVGLRSLMQGAHVGHTATRLEDGHVLVAGGLDVTGEPSSSAEIYDPSTKTWTSTTSMSTARSDHTATLLGNGQVLVAGGALDGAPSAEIYDPGSQTWTPTEPMSTARKGHTATLLLDGRVVVVGGASATTSAEIYDPSSGSTATWKQTGPMSSARQGHTATRLQNGLVLVAGGAGPNALLATAETLDPSSPTLGWTLLAHPMSTARYHHTATLLGDGRRVLVAGGSDASSQTIPAVEIFEPSGATWQPAPPMKPRSLHTATLLDDGRVLVAGGVVYDTLGADEGAEVFDPSTEAWTSLEQMHDARSGHTATLLEDGHVLVAGGESGSPGAHPLDSAEIFDTSSPGWTPTESTMSTARADHTATLLPDHTVLVAGGLDATGQPSFGAEIYDASAKTWTPTAMMSTARQGHAATLLSDGSVLVSGGIDPTGQPSDSAEVYHPTQGTWTPTNAMSSARKGHAATLLSDGRVLVSGGIDLTGQPSASAEVYDPSAQTWKPARSMMNTAREAHTATLLLDGTVLVAGGSDDGVHAVRSAEIHDPGPGTWRLTASMSTARDGHTATLLLEGLVLVAGGAFDSSGHALPSAEFFAASTRRWARVPQMNTLRARHTATLLLDGRALAAGGELVDVFSTHRVLASAELFDFSASHWTTMPSMSAARARHTATRLADGRVLVAGGVDATGQPTASAEIFGLQPTGTGCTTPLDCLSGFCAPRNGGGAGGVCCDQPCNKGGCDACSEADGATVDGTCTQLVACSPYACLPATGMCLSACQTIDDCADGYVCDSSGACDEATPNQPYRDDRGCALSSSDERTPTAIALGLLAALRIARRARRRPG
jgi:N-acetylneuraminic acid mutarotase